MTEPIKLTTPLAESAIRSLRVGRQVLLSGVIVTARDAAHRYLVERGRDDPFPFDLAGSAIYHCGPVVTLEEDQWRVVSAGPTTSMRMAMYQGKVLKRYTPAGKKLVDAAYAVSDRLPAVLSQRRKNRGFESVAVSRDGKTAYTMTQSPLGSTKPNSATRRGNSLYEC